MKKTTDKQTTLFYLLIGAGIVVCILTELEKISPAVRALCGGDESGCVEVGNSPFSTFYGVPLGYLGLLSYVTWAGIYRYRREWAGLFGAVVLGVEFFLLYIMLYVLQTVCNLCAAQFTVVVLLNVLLFISAYPPKRRSAFRAATLPVALVAFAALYMPAQAFKASISMESITSWGRPASPVVVELFSDYQCPYCEKFEAVVKKIMEQYPDVYILFRDFLIQGHAYSPMAVAYADSIAYYQGREKYLEERFKIYENQQRIREYVEPRLKRVTKDLEMQKAVKAKIDRDMARARSLGVNATPTMVLVKNGKVKKIMRGVYPFETIKKEIDALLSES
ncbi:MAG: thioredoxin domain-containing protein [Nitrospinota bacterium]